jgi:hypothetical protein
MINRVLDISQLKAVITLIFRGKALKIDRILKNTGIHKKSCWVCYFNEKGDRWSTFISKADLQKAFWEWFLTIRLLELNDNDRLHLGRAIYIILKPGDAVFKSSGSKMGIVVEKRLTPKTNYPEILVEWGDLVRWERAIALQAQTNCKAIAFKS